jgi:hypothetical protein
MLSVDPRQSTPLECFDNNQAAQVNVGAEQGVLAEMKYDTEQRAELLRAMTLFPVPSGKALTEAITRDSGCCHGTLALRPAGWAPLGQDQAQRPTCCYPSEELVIHGGVASSSIDTSPGFQR